MPRIGFLLVVALIAIFCNVDLPVAPFIVSVRRTTSNKTSIGLSKSRKKAATNSKAKRIKKQNNIIRFLLYSPFLNTPNAIESARIMKQLIANKSIEERALQINIAMELTDIET